jgi:hypothetical protein
MYIKLELYLNFSFPQFGYLMTFFVRSPLIFGLGESWQFRFYERQSSGKAFSDLFQSSKLHSLEASTAKKHEWSLRVRLQLDGCLEILSYAGGNEKLFLVFLFINFSFTNFFHFIRKFCSFCYCRILDFLETEIAR